MARMRHYGFLSSGYKAKRLVQCRVLLGQPAPQEKEELPTDRTALLLALTGVDRTRCPLCREGKMVIVERLLRQPSSTRAVAPERTPQAEQPQPDDAEDSS
jgi:hypothetical protein